MLLKPFHAQWEAFLAAVAADSLAVAGETLFYLSRAGVMAYTGGNPMAYFTDVRPFLKDASCLDIWSRDYFSALVDMIKFK